jgi:hypothetical protein
MSDLLVVKGNLGLTQGQSVSRLSSILPDVWCPSSANNRMMSLGAMIRETAWTPSHTAVP